LDGKLFGGEMIWNGEVIEGISKDEIETRFLLAIHHKPSPILIKGLDSGIL